MSSEGESGRWTDESITWKIEDFPTKIQESNVLKSEIKNGKNCSFAVGTRIDDATGRVMCQIHLENLIEGGQIWFTVCLRGVYAGDISGKKNFIVSREMAAKGSTVIELFTGLTKRELLMFETGYISKTGTVTFSLDVQTALPWDSKKETGCIGLKNQGATCYMNSALQSLFHLPAFRRLVYDMPTTGTEDPETSIPLNLQRLFCNMQFRDKAASTKALTKSFGWGDMETIMQHDVQEFCRVLIDNLEMKLKGTEFQESIAELFRGKTKSYIRCINVDYESARTQEFYDLSMVVRGCKNLKESFDKYCEEEKLDGDNQYSTDDHGKQDAVMGVEFVELPAILQLHLRRFEYDFNYDMMVKVNDKFEFPEVLDLSEYLKCEGEKPCCTYELFGVLVHLGNVAAGHYYTFLRKSQDPDWFKFDDEEVTPAKKETAIDDNFGGRAPGSRYGKSYSGYMLVYVRQSEIEKIFAKISDEEVPSHLLDYLKKQDEIRKAKKDALIECTKTAVVKIQNNDTLKRSALQGLTGFKTEDVCCELKLDRTSTFSELYDAVAEKLEVDRKTLRLWVTNDNHYPTKVLPDNNRGYISVIAERLSPFGVHLFLETKKEDEELLLPADTVTFYAKFFFQDDIDAKIQFIDSVKLPKSAPLDSARAILNEKLGFPADTEMLAYLETVTGRVKIIDIDQKIELSEIGNGSVVIFQLKEGVILPTTFELQPAIAVESDKKEKTFDDDVPVINASDLIPLVSDTVGKYVNSKLEDFIDVYDCADLTKPLFHLKHGLMAMKTFKRVVAMGAKWEYNPAQDSLMIYRKSLYEDKPELDISNNLRVADLRKQSWYDRDLTPRIYVEMKRGISEEELQDKHIFTVEVSTDGTTIAHVVRHLDVYRTRCGDIAKNVLTQLGLDLTPDQYRLFFVAEGMIDDYYGEVSHDKEAYPTVPLRIDVIPEDQKELQEGEFLVAVSPVARSAVYTGYYDATGPSFMFKLLPGEKFVDTKERICAMLPEDKQKEFKEYTFRFQSDRKVVKIELNDDTVLADELDPTRFSVIGLVAKKSSTRKTRYREDAVKFKH